MISQITLYAARQRFIAGMNPVCRFVSRCLARAFGKVDMDRFLSNTINKVDKKGRVSVPAPFRPVLGGINRLYTMMSVDQPCIDAGGVRLFESYEAELEKLNRFSVEYETLSFVLHGDSDELKIDAEGRIVVSDAIREKTGIRDWAAFVGRGDFFQIWEPDKFLAYRSGARKKVAEMRRAMSGLAGGGLTRQEEHSG